MVASVLGYSWNISEILGVIEDCAIGFILSLNIGSIDLNIEVKQKCTKSSFTCEWVALKGSTVGLKTPKLQVSR